MQCITKCRFARCYWRWGATLHWVALISLILLAVLGIQLESSAGWLACPPSISTTSRNGADGRSRRSGFAWQAGWNWMRQSWRVAALRSATLWLLGRGSGWPPAQWLGLLPCLEWLGQGVAVAWPALRRQPGYQLLLDFGRTVRCGALIGLMVCWSARQLAAVATSTALVLGAGCVQEQPQVTVHQDPQGVYRVSLRGEFSLQLDGQVEFYKRLLIIFLYLLDGDRRGSRWTRDGRTPLLSQQQLAAWFEVPHPCISRWTGYFLEQDWRRLLSRRQGDPLTLETQQRIIDCWVQFPWWSAERLWQHLREQGESILLAQVRQAARESGWSRLRVRLGQVYAVSRESLRPRDDWLVSQLLAQVQHLVAELEALGGLTPERRLELTDLQTLSQEVGVSAAPTPKPLPWLGQVEHRLFGHWQAVEADTVRCRYCGSSQVSRKSRTPRLKKYWDEQGQLQTVAVYRYYCHNPACDYQSFTDLPPDLLPHSRYPLSRRLAALQLYVWGRGVYRRCGQMLGLGKMTTYRWVAAFGHALLPVAALFGVLRSSGVVGIDEKYVLVPHSDKPQAKLKRWMYIYFAVDAYTYDLLHLDLYPYNDADSAQAFLLALRAKGYQPRVLVTDMRADYSRLIQQVFPKAVHHECIFHALQQVRKHIKESYGSNYAEQFPQVLALRDQIDQIFDARTKRTAHRRYQKVLAQRETFVSQTPAAVAIFDFLERHWPRLLNAIESQLIPTTNNATEQVIRIFNQHYKTFCGFQSIESARAYLAVFEKVYRFTPFSQDAQPKIRGQCPLELAGYEVAKLPIAQLIRAWVLQWPEPALEELVPNV